MERRKQKKLHNLSSFFLNLSLSEEVRDEYLFSLSVRFSSIVVTFMIFFLLLNDLCDFRTCKSFNLFDLMQWNLIVIVLKSIIKCTRRWSRAACRSWQSARQNHRLRVCFINSTDLPTCKWNLIDSTFATDKQNMLTPAKKNHTHKLHSLSEIIMSISTTRHNDKLHCVITIIKKKRYNWIICCSSNKTHKK